MSGRETRRHNKTRSRESKHEVYGLLKVSRGGVYTEEVIYHNLNTGIAWMTDAAKRGNNH